MRESKYNNVHAMVIGNWDWQPQKLKEQYGQLTLADVTFRPERENDLLTRIGIRLNKTLPEVMDVLKKLKPF